MRQFLSNILPFGKAWLGFCLLVSCSSTKNVTTPVIEERIYHDTIKSIQQQRDSIYLHDSIYMSRVGDTVYLEKWHTTYAERIKYRDSIKVQRDTIPVEVKTTETVTEEVKYIPWYYKLLAALGCFFLFLCAVQFVWLWWQYKKS